MGQGMTSVTLFSLLSGDPCLHSVIAIQVFLYMFIFLLRINKPQNILPKHVYKYGFLHWQVSISIILMI